MPQSKSLVGVPTGEASTVGRPIYMTPEGESVSEKSITFPINLENKTVWVNAPSIHEGVRYSEDEVREMIDSGEVKATSVHDSKEEAIGAAQERSPTLINYSKGGQVNQMKKLFADGGMMDDSGEVVNDVKVPTGSLQEEVADDIPAMLSEGEFVFPADVVRYLGLETLMRLRDKAKTGLSRMEEIGQVGNAKEVDDPDQTFNNPNFESDIDEIITEVDNDQTKQFAAGGYMSGTDLSQAPKNSAVDVRYFKHSDGRVMYITHINGKPQTLVPDGFSEISLEETRLIGKEAEDKEEFVKDMVENSGGGDSDAGASTSATGGWGIGVSVENGVATAQSVNPTVAGFVGAIFGGPLGGVAAKAAANAFNTSAAENAVAAQTAINANFDYNDLTDAEGGPGMGVSGANNEASHDEDGNNPGIGSTGAAATGNTTSTGANNEDSHGADGNNGGTGDTSDGSTDGANGMGDLAKGGLIRRRNKAPTKSRKGLASKK